MNLRDFYLPGGPNSLSKALARDRKVAFDRFYDTPEWLKLRYQTLKRFGGRCQCCGCRPSRGRLHVDHIKPRSRCPELELDPNNVQVLCDDCNYGKGGWDETDWRWV